MGNSDDEILAAFYETVTPNLEELVTSAIHQGHRVRDIALVFERKFDGKVAACCLGRRAVDGYLRGMKGVDSVAREMIVAAVSNAMANEIPTVLLVHNEGFISVGIRRIEGKMSWLS